MAKMNPAANSGPADTATVVTEVTALLQQAMDKLSAIGAPPEEALPMPPGPARPPLDLKGGGF
jgi:hypothetical protein